MGPIAREQGGFTVRGQEAAVDAARALLDGHVPHAILIVGPPSVGKATFALDLATALLCTDADAARRPCRACRGCRLAANGTHPDLHRLVGDGKAGEIRIGDHDDAEPGTVRAVVADLALLSSEGGHRVVIADRADRMNEDAQNALLKMLEEPPPGVVILLCASDEERLLPTVRSRCARIRLGTLGVREIEGLLADLELADAPAAARIARIAAGRPGLAIALAASPEAIEARGEITRSLLDGLAATTTTRLGRLRELVALAGKVAAASDGDPAPAAAPPAPAAPARSGGGAGDDGDGPDAEPTDEEAPAAGPASKTSPAQRRRAALTLIGIWRALARDLLVVVRGGRELVGDPGLLEELERAANGADADALVAFLARAERTARLIERNANPELALDVLVLAWPRIAR